MEKLAGAAEAWIEKWEKGENAGAFQVCLSSQIIFISLSIYLNAPDIFRWSDVDLPPRAAYNLSSLRGAARQPALMETLLPLSTWIRIRSHSSLSVPPRR